MLRKIEVTALFVLAFCLSAMAAPRQELKIVPNPQEIGVRDTGDVIRIEWVQLASVGSAAVVPVPLPGRVYYSRTPAGGDLSKYTALAAVLPGSDNVEVDFSATAKKRRISFTPRRQGIGMGPGTYYCIVASFTESGDTLYSDYFQLMVESPVAPTLDSPKGSLTQRVAVTRELTPQFRWRHVPGVPYYHIILSDEPIVDMSGSEPKANENIGVIWQAIVPATSPFTSITYGAPDPSGTLTATPPPLSPGKTYSWMVLNNYGNHIAYSSGKFNVDDLLLAQFRIDGGAGFSMAAPKVISPKSTDSFSYTDVPSTIDIEWTNLAQNANSFLVNLSTAAPSHDLGVEGMGEMNANLLVWETAVARGNARVNDTLRVRLDAGGTLTASEYTVRIYALDSRGAASTADSSNTTFRYTPNAGTLNLKAVEVIGGVNLPVGFAELHTEVISGPTQAPLAFYTDSAGIFRRTDFPVGRFRVTASKEGYESKSVTVNVNRGSAAPADTIFMVRPQAVMFGRVIMPDSTPVNLARVTAISEWGDTLTVFTSGTGSFTLSCRAAQWTVSIDKAGHSTYTSPRINLRPGDNRDAGAIMLSRNPNTVSGVIRNAAGEAVIGARVRVLTSEGVLVDELASTPQSGSYVFYLRSGSYVLTAEKPGFAMFSRQIHVTASSEHNIMLREGAALLNGVIVGKSWSADEGDDGGFVYAPVTSATVRFWDSRGDTLKVMTDATFGRFSISLPVDTDYSVRAEAAGFDMASSRVNTLSTEGGGTLQPFSDTLAALFALKGTVVLLEDGSRVQGVDVFVKDGAGRTVASGRTTVDGSYEVRNIPNGVFRVAAGRSGYYQVGDWCEAPEPGAEPNPDVYADGCILSISDGRPLYNHTGGYNFTMDIGNRSIEWRVTQPGGLAGQIKIVSPFNKSVEFDARNNARIDSVGAGIYQFEAVAESHDSLLELSYRRFEVGEDASFDDPHLETVVFRFKHISPRQIRMAGDRYELVVDQTVTGGAGVERIVLFYRNEGSVRFSSVTRSIPAVGGEMKVEFGQDGTVRDGTNLQYYFNVYSRDGDIYGSSKQIFTTYVEPNEKVISRIAVEPGAAGGDTLVLPSAYDVQLAFTAFYSDQFRNIASGSNIGRIEWTVRDADASGQVVRSGEGAVFTYQTPAPGNVRNLVLTAKLTTANSDGYIMKGGSMADSVTFPIRVTGSSLASIAVRRRGNAGSIPSTGEAGFSVEALDRDGAAVSVSPKWEIYPASAAREEMGPDATFKPDHGFIGSARIVARVGGIWAEYAEAGAAPGQNVFYTLRNNAAGADTANTQKGFKLVFPPNSVSRGDNVNFEVTVPELQNYVHRGTKEFKMADSVAFDLECDEFASINDSIVLVFDIPVHLREAARKNNHQFAVARWVPDSLMWIPIEGSELIGNAAVKATLRAVKEEAAQENSADGGVQLKRGARRMGKRAAVGSNASAPVLRAAGLTSSARYALVTKTDRLSLDVAVSPNPFSPYIRPVREYGLDAPAGTCIRVNVEAPDASVKSIKVQIYNATGTRVWAVERLTVETGETRFWWNGRTSGRGSGRTSVSEEIWDANMHLRTDRPMARNGRYFVVVIVTDFYGEQKRVMKPLVLMK